MLRMRLRRVGKKGKPSYRIVVAEATAPRDGAYLEWIGNYDPMADPPVVTLKGDRAVHWLERGAQPSDAVKRILDKNGILERALVYRAATSSSVGKTTEEGAPVATAVAAESVDDIEHAAEDEGQGGPSGDEAPTGDETPDETPVDEISDEAPTDEPSDEAPADEISDETPTAEEISGEATAGEISDEVSPDETPDEAPEE